MLEALVHNQLKHLLRGIGYTWPHHLTFSRFVARSIRRGDKTLIELECDSQEEWWLGLLIPLCLDSSNSVLVLSEKLYRRFVKYGLPSLREKGLNLPYWKGKGLPLHDDLWIIDYEHLVHLLRQGTLKSKYLIIPEAQSFSMHLGHAMSLKIDSYHWDVLRRSCPSIDLDLIKLYEQLTRNILSTSTYLNPPLSMDSSEVVTLKNLISTLSPLPSPWDELFYFDSLDCASWAELDNKSLTWDWCLRPLYPLKHVQSFLKDQSILFVSSTLQNTLLRNELESVNFSLNVNLKLDGPFIQEPILVFAPSAQPLPNTEIYSNHLLVQSRRLILAQSGLTIVLLDDHQLSRQLMSALAAEFGRRVDCEKISPEPNGVLGCRWSWWIEHQDELPVPGQLIVGLLPLPSLEDPLTAAKVQSLKKEGRDWFREFLLPEALSLFSQAVDPIRGQNTRLAVLDGRIRSRTWGKHFLRALEPWDSLQHLIPD